MQDLKVIGKQRVGKIEFTGIEGGFGEDKKAMLVKDIAAIHGKEPRQITQAINRQINRFREGIDIIDLKSSADFKITLCDLNFSNKEISNSKNIYLLSERGYAKLLKILDDDKAWEIYDELVDNYFTMRQAIRTNQPALTSNKRLEIMERNANSRMIKLIFQMLPHYQSASTRAKLMAKAANLVTDDEIKPEAPDGNYTAAEVGEKLGVSKQKVGRVCNELNLKAAKPGENQYGRWIQTKSPYSPKEVLQWLYTEAGVEAIKQAL